MSSKSKLSTNKNSNNDKVQGIIKDCVTLTITPVAWTITIKRQLVKQLAKWAATSSGSTRQRRVCAPKSRQAIHASKASQACKCFLSLSRLVHEHSRAFMHAARAYAKVCIWVLLFLLLAGLCKLFVNLFCVTAYLFANDYACVCVCAWARLYAQLLKLIYLN